MALVTVQASQEAAPQVEAPRHVAIIMDGNGRWAKQQGMPRLSGHKAGTQRIHRVLRALGGHGVRYVTIYAFSTENWGRPNREVAGLLELLERMIREEVPKLHAQNVRILHLGSLKRLPKHLVQAIEQALELTKDNTGLTICVGFDYGGRAEIVEAVRRIVAQGVDPEGVTEETIRRHLCLPDVPDPELIIRTAGEQRLSNFLLWQAAYSEMYYTATFWPDFDEAEVEKALDWYSHRERRFGKLLPEA